MASGLVSNLASGVTSGVIVRRRFVRVRAALTVVVASAVLVGGGLAGGQQAVATVDPLRLGRAAATAPGVEYQRFSLTVPRGTAHGHLLTVNLSTPGVSVDLLHPGAVGARAPVSAMADARGALGAVNGDFFNISESQHPGVEATGAAVGPAVAAGGTMKSAVPDGQRFGPAMPPGTTTEDVFTVGLDDRARLDRLSLEGSMITADSRTPLRGLNLYALPVDGIGAYTPLWGPRSRVRATCGTDYDRAAPCSTDTYEVTVRQGRVASVADVPGSGGVPSDAVVLVGRDEGARQLRKLSVGDPVAVTHRLTGQQPVPPRVAVGGFPILRDDAPPAGLDPVVPAIRTSAGIGPDRRDGQDGQDDGQDGQDDHDGQAAQDGQVVYLLALDGTAGNAGLTIAELSWLMERLGAVDAMNLDGGGSSTLALRDPATGAVTVRNHPSGGAERPVPNGIGVFTAEGP